MRKDRLCLCGICNETLGKTVRIYKEKKSEDYYYFFNLFILRETETVSGGGADGEERERILSRLSTEPDAGFEPTKCEIMA